MRQSHYSEEHVECLYSIVSAFCWYYAKVHNVPYMCAPFWRYAKALGLVKELY